MGRRRQVRQRVLVRAARALCVWLVFGEIPRIKLTAVSVANTVDVRRWRMVHDGERRLSEKHHLYLKVSLSPAVMKNGGEQVELVTSGDLPCFSGEADFLGSWRCC